MSAISQLPQRYWSIVSAVALLMLTISQLNAQQIILDQDGPHLYVAGTPADDVIYVWDDGGEIMVYVNGKTTNVSAETALRSSDLISVGANLFGGDDFISFEWMPSTPQGTRTNGGEGIDDVLAAPGRNQGNGVWLWEEGEPEPANQSVATISDDALVPQDRKAPNVTTPKEALKHSNPKSAP